MVLGAVQWDNPLVVIRQSTNNQWLRTFSKLIGTD
jgi:hypothetical protein